MTKPPPTLLSLTIENALLHLSSFSDLSPLPDHILLELFARTLRAGKLNEKILKLFIATGQDEVLSFIEELNIQPIITPILPTHPVLKAELKVPEGFSADVHTNG